MMIKHNKKYFYKYVTSDVAQIVLNTLRVRCSSPLAFNDPFDSQIPINIGPASIKKQIGNLLNYVDYDIRLKKGFEQIFSIMNEKQLRDKLKAFNERIYKTNREDRIFCVSGVKDNILMWSHYAENHRGAVIQFKCMPEKDTGLCGAYEVNYSNTMPNLSILDFAVDLIKPDYIANRINNEILLTKSIDWSYEKEWRVILFPRSDKSHLPDNEQYDDILVLEDEIDSIYLGCNMTKVQKNKIIDIIKNKRKKVKIFEASKKEQSFELKFKRIDL